MKKKNFNDVKREIESQGSVWIDDKYINSVTDLNMRCVCGNVFKKKYKTMHRSKKYICNKCIDDKLNKNKLIPFSDIKKQLKDIGMDILVLESEYKGINYKYKFKCDEGHITKSILKDVLSKNKGCKKCHHINMGVNQMILYNELIVLYGKESYKILTTEDEYYKNKSGHILVKCEKHHIFLSNIMNFKHNNARCPFCNNENRGKVTLISYKDRVKQVEMVGYKMITKKEEYVNGNTDVIIECNKGHKFLTTMHKFSNGARCTKCNMSNGEIEVEKILLKNNIKYKTQYYFRECRNLRQLPFDFYLPQYNCCIEYDGKQHYKYGCFGRELLDLMNQKRNDNIKTQYCKDDNIKLIRIPYWEFDNIENILIKELNLNKYE